MTRSASALASRELAVARAPSTGRLGSCPARPPFVRGTETFVELTYQFTVTPWWQLQPDFQYIFNPGGGIQNPNDPAKHIGNEAIFGLRTVFTF